MKFFAFALAAASLVAAEEFKVIVGRDEAGAVANVFTPSQVTAKVGDVVHFEFRAKNHTVTQSSFAEPCTQQFNTVTQLKGIDSGFHPAPDGAPTVSVYSVEVRQDKGPIWMFCARDPHCNAGMVFAINAPTTGEKTFEAFKTKAATANHPAYGTTADFTPPNAPAPAPPTDQAPVGGQVTDPSLDPAAPPANQVTDPALTPPTNVGASPQADNIVSVVTPQPSSIAANSNTTSTSGALSARSVSAGVAVSFVGVLAAALL
jgi:plastocyanin